MTENTTNLRVALYLRVSTADQTHEPQRQELLQYCERRGWRDPVEFLDVISGAKFTRTGLEKLKKAVRKKQFDVLLVVKLDRLGRSLTDMANLINEFFKANVALICTSQSIDTSASNPAGQLQMHILMAVAQFERELIRERTKAGMVAAKARGAAIGRPRIANESLAWKVALCLEREPRPSLRAIVKELGVSLGTVQRLAKIPRKK